MNSKATALLIFIIVVMFMIGYYKSIKRNSCSYRQSLDREEQSCGFCESE